MPAYLAAFDVCTIPFKINPITEATDPVKFYEYVSQGKPVVATRMHELEVYSDLLYLADTPSTFVEKLDRAVREQDEIQVQRRIALARTNTWSARLQAIKSGIVDAHPRASIVIVTYGNLDVTKECLRSVFQNTLYPNLEVIVVDNGSSDGTPQFLRKLERKEPKLQVILNPDNRGFAAANNQGLALATGQCLVLLNNDTVVPPGWLSRLIRHLGNPEHGLVNAVTNFSGNESRVEVPYTDIADMPEFARTRGRAFDSEVFDIAVAAMYCVAMRRDVFERVGPLDEKFGIGMFEDDDYSHRTRIAGYRVVCAEDAFVHHYGQASFKKLSPDEYQKIWDQNQAWYEEKWKTRWKAHVARKWSRGDSALPTRLAIELFFTKLRKDHEFRESEKARYLESRHLQDELTARETQLEVVKRDLFLLQQQYEWIIRSRGWKVLQVAWSVAKKLKPKAERETRLAPDAFAPVTPAAPPLEAEAAAVSVGEAVSSSAEVSDSSFALAPITDPNRFDIVCFPTIEWNFRFQRPQQLATELARLGHRVFYVSHDLRPDGDLYRWTAVRPGVFEVSLRGPARDVFVQSLTRTDIDQLLEALDRFRLEQQLATTIAIPQLPFWGPVARQVREQFGWRVIYDCMDLHSGFATAPKQLIEHETDLIRQADLVTVSSSALHDQVKHQNSNVVLLRNGCDFDHFSKAAERGSPHQQDKSRPLIGYYGAVAEWFDVDLVAALARKHPEWDFVIVGSTAAADVTALRRPRNVSLAGERSYAEIPGWLERFDVAIIPFLLTPLTRATNPVKAYEMLAAGKPVVSSPLPEMMVMAPLVRIASGLEGFEKEITEALVFDYEPVMVERRRAFARQNTWRARAATLLRSAEGLFPKVQVIALDRDHGQHSDYPAVTFSVASSEEAMEDVLDSDMDVVVLTTHAHEASGRGRIGEAVREVFDHGQDEVLLRNQDGSVWGVAVRPDVLPDSVEEAFSRLLGTSRAAQIPSTKA